MKSKPAERAKKASKSTDPAVANPVLVPSETCPTPALSWRDLPHLITGAYPFYAFLDMLSSEPVCHIEPGCHIPCSNTSFLGRRPIAKGGRTQSTTSTGKDVNGSAGSPTDERLALLPLRLSGGVIHKLESIPEVATLIEQGEASRKKCTSPPSMQGPANRAGSLASRLRAQREARALDLAGMSSKSEEPNVDAPNPPLETSEEAHTLAYALARSRLRAQEVEAARERLQRKQTAHQLRVAVLRAEDRSARSRAAREERKYWVGERYRDLVTFGPGLAIVTAVAGGGGSGLVPSSDLVQFTIRNIPNNAHHREITALFEAQGIHSSLYAPVIDTPSSPMKVDLEPDDRSFYTKALCWMREAEARVLAERLDGIAFGPEKMRLRFEVDEVRSMGPMVCMGKGRSAMNTGAGGQSYSTRLSVWGVRSDQYKYQTVIPLRRYQAQKAEWDGMRRDAKGWAASVRIKEKEKEGLVSIKVQGPEEASVGALKVRVEGLLAGTLLGEEYWNNSFAKEVVAQELVDRVWREAGAFGLVGKERREVKVWASPRSLEEAKRIVKEEVERWEARGIEISFKAEPQDFRESTIIPIFHNILGEDSVTKDPNGLGHLTLRSSSANIDFALTLIARAKADYQRGLPCLPLPHIPDLEASIKCPVCFETPTPILSRQRLSCKHVYCASCLKHYLASAITGGAFPLCCMGNENRCRRRIPLSIIKHLLSPAQHEQLLQAALRAHVQANAQTVRYCATPGCGLAYCVERGKDTSGIGVQCRACLAFCCTCPPSSDAPHTNLTCAQHLSALAKRERDQRIKRDQAEQARLAEAWARANSDRVKKCPSCAVLVEKTEGCHHMTCRCGVHWCWVCRGVHSRQTIYGHITSAHG